MLRKIGGVVAGLVVWLITISALGAILRASWPAYASAAPSMAFTLPMLVSRLAIGALATVAAGFVSAFVGSRAPFWILLPGLLLLAAFIPVHMGLWEKFPVWYHLTFLLSLVPLTYLGGRIRSWSRRDRRNNIDTGRAEVSLGR